METGSSYENAPKSDGAITDFFPSDDEISNAAQLLVLLVNVPRIEEAKTIEEKSGPDR